SPSSVPRWGSRPWSSAQPTGGGSNASLVSTYRRWRAALHRYCCIHLFQRSISAERFLLIQVASGTTICCATCSAVGIDSCAAGLIFATAVRLGGVQVRVSQIFAWTSGELRKNSRSFSASALFGAPFIIP